MTHLDHRLVYVVLGVVIYAGSLAVRAVWAIDDPTGEQVVLGMLTAAIAGHSYRSSTPPAPGTTASTSSTSTLTTTEAAP